MKTIEEYAAALAKSDAELDIARKQLAEERKSHETAKSALQGNETKLVTLDSAFARLVSLFAAASILVKADQPREPQIVEAVEKLLGEVATLKDKTIESEVSSLVGVKITPAEKSEFIELAKNNRPLFERMVKNRPNMTVLGGPVLGEDKSAPPNVQLPPANQANGAALAQKIFGTG
jgi:hypothetical protein